MNRVRFSEEQIISVLREHEAGAKTADLARKQRGLRGDALQLEGQVRRPGGSEAKRLKTLEEENRKLKKLLAESMLREALGKNF